MVARHSEVVATFCDGSLALLFRLPRGRFLVGFALGDDGMLFRGELLDTCTAEQAKAAALAVADYWAERDAEDEAEGPESGAPDAEDQAESPEANGKKTKPVAESEDEDVDEGDEDEGGDDDTNEDISDGATADGDAVAAAMAAVYHLSIDRVVCM